MEKSDSNLVELTRVYDPIEADLLAAFLEDGDIEFHMRRSARTMASLMPSSETPVKFMVYEQDLEQAKSLLEEYSAAQNASVPPDENAASDSDDE